MFKYLLIFEDCDGIRVNDLYHEKKYSKEQFDNKLIEYTKKKDGGIV